MILIKKKKQVFYNEGNILPNDLEKKHWDTWALGVYISNLILSIQREIETESNLFP